MKKQIFVIFTVDDAEMLGRADVDDLNFFWGLADSFEAALASIEEFEPNGVRWVSGVDGYTNVSSMTGTLTYRFKEYEVYTG